MASKQDNYLRMHHPSIFKKMKKGGKIEDYAKGGKVKYYAYGGRNTDTVPAMLTPGEVVLNEKQQIAIGNTMAGGGKVSAGQAKADALFKHVGVPGFQEGQKVPYKSDFEYEPRNIRRTQQLYAPKIEGVESDYEYFKESAPEMALSGKAPWGGSYDISKLIKEQHEAIDPKSKYRIMEDYDIYERSVPEMKPMKKGLLGRLFKAEGGLVDKKDALMAYYNGGKVDITDVVKSAEKAKRFEVKAEKTGKPIYTKKKKIHRRKAKKQAGEVLLEYYMGGRVKKKKKKQKRGY